MPILLTATSAMRKEFLIAPGDHVTQDSEVTRNFMKKSAKNVNPIDL